MYDLIEKSCLFIVNILYHQTIYCTILFVLIFGLAYLLKGKSPYWQLGLWFLILFRLLLPIDLSFSLSARNLIDDFPLIDKINVSVDKVSNKLGINQNSYQNFELNRFDRTGDQRDKKTVFDRNLSKDLNRSISWPIILAMVWFLGCLISLIFFLNKIYSINRVLNHSALIQDKRITAFIEYWRQTFKIRRSVNIFSSNGFLSPFTVGLFRPKIFIPQSLIKGADNETVNSIIAHEMVHIKNFDYLWIRLQSVLQIIYFFHPVVWYANRQITLARERICDWIVLAKRVIPPREYGKGVIKVLEFNLFGYRLVEPLPYFSNHKIIFEHRIRDILKEDTMKTQKTLIVFITVCLLGLFLLPLSNSQTDSPVYWPTKEWKTSTPEEQKMDSTKLEQINAYVEENCPKLRSILISRNGYIVFEKYYSGDANYANEIDAATMSITSALIGIALDQGHIKNIDQKMYTFFPEYASGITDPRRKKITIRHLLTMTPGFSRGDGLWDMEFDFKQLISFEPGETPAYNRSASHLLSGIITKSTNMSTLQFADKYLFKSLGIPTPRWRTGFGGYNQGGWGLYMTTRDMAKIGYLYLRNGVWDGRQIIPKKWVKESTQKHSSNPIESISSVEIDSAYGYQLWVLTLH